MNGAVVFLACVRDGHLYTAPLTHTIAGIASVTWHDEGPAPAGLAGLAPPPPAWAPGAGCGRPVCLVHCTHIPLRCRCSFTKASPGYCMTAFSRACPAHGAIHG